MNSYKEIDIYGTVRWYLEGTKLFHREDGPAIEWSDDTKYWYRNGKLHRLDGPAIEYLSGAKYWYYEGQPINCSSQEEFERLIKLKAFW